MEEGYPRYIRHGHKPFDPLQLASWTEDIVCKDSMRRYTDFYELPYSAIRYLIRGKISFHVAAMSDPRLMPTEERATMLKKLNEIGYKDFLEEETCDPYHHTIYRLKEAGLTIFKHEV